MALLGFTDIMSIFDLAINVPNLLSTGEEKTNNEQTKQMQAKQDMQDFRKQQGQNQTAKTRGRSKTHSR